MLEGRETRLANTSLCPISPRDRKSEVAFLRELFLYSSSVAYLFELVANEFEGFVDRVCVTRDGDDTFGTRAIADIDLCSTLQRIQIVVFHSLKFEVAFQTQFVQDL